MDLDRLRGRLSETASMGLDVAVSRCGSALGTAAAFVALLDSDPGLRDEWEPIGQEFPMGRLVADPSGLSVDHWLGTPLTLGCAAALRACLAMAGFYELDQAPAGLLVLCLVGDRNGGAAQSLIKDEPTWHEELLELVREQLIGRHLPVVERMLPMLLRQGASQAMSDEDFQARVADTAAVAGDEVDRDRLALASNVLRYAESRSWADAAQIVSDHPELLSEAGLVALEVLVLSVGRTGDAEAERRAREVRRFLLRCADAGPGRALAESAWLEPEQETGLLESALMQYMETDSWAEARAVLERHGELLTDLRVRTYLDRAVITAAQNGLPSFVEELGRSRRFLLGSAEDGIARAFAEIVGEFPEKGPPPDDETATMVFEELMAEAGNATADQCFAMATLSRSVTDLAEADGRAEHLRILRDRRELHSEPAGRVLERLASYEDDEDGDFTSCLRLIRRYAEVGDRAVEELVPDDAEFETHRSDEEQAGAIDIPPEFEEDFRKAAEADQRELLPGVWHGSIGSIGMEASEVLWDRIARRPDFPSAPRDLRIAVHISAAFSCQRRYFRTEAGQARDMAIDHLSKAVALCLPDNPGLFGWKSVLAGLYQERYVEHGKRLGDLEAALLLYEELGGRSLADVEMLNAYGAALHARYERRGDLPDLTAGIEVLERVVHEVPDNPKYLTNLMTALCSRFTRMGDLADLDRAIGHGRAAADATPVGDAERHGRLQMVANVLGIRFERLGQLSDLDEAIDFGRAAVEAIDALPPSLPTMMDRVSGHLSTELQTRGLPTDFADGLRAEFGAEQYVHHDLPGLLSNLGVDLAARSQLTESQADLEEALALHRQAVELTPPDHPDRHKCLSNLGNAHLYRFRHSAEVDLNAAILLGRLALESVPKEHPHRAVLHSSLQHAYSARFPISGDPADREAAIDHARAAKQACPRDHTDYGRYLFELIGAEDEPDRDGSWLESSPEVAELETLESVPPLYRAATARLLANQYFERGSYTEALERFAVAVDLVPLLAWRGLDRDSKERRLIPWSGLGTEAAACAMAAGNHQQAVELLERGRSVLWGQARELRDDLRGLELADENLAARLKSALSILDPGAGSTADERIHHALQLDAVLADIREAGFLEPMPFQKLAGAVHDGAVAIVNVNRRRCDALLIQDGQVIPWELHVTAAEIADRARLHLRDLGRFSAAPTSANRELLDGQLDELLEWLWLNIAQPCLDRLDLKPGSRLWWCPTGPLSFVPLHAAGLRAGPYVGDRVVPSYTATLSDLLKASGQRKSDNSLLTVAVPFSPGLPLLHNAVAEATEVGRLFPGRHTSLHNADATCANVKEAMETHAWAHFACHGGQNPWRPGRGALYLADGPLSLPELAGLRLDGAEFAYLSACQSALGVVTLPDESVHMAAALQSAGYRHVISALWSIGDERAMEVAAEIYNYLAGGIPHANALHATVEELRAEYLGFPSVWAPYVHFGP